jgi:glycosyltransferase involved in cell wall biosynthesis
MRLAWILPRYGPHVLGGAETHARVIIEQLARRGHTLEVWTTCARDIYTWANELPAGVEDHHGIVVRRFAVDAPRQVNIWTDSLTANSQYMWAEGLPHSPQMEDHIRRHGETFDLLLFMPYSAGTTYHGARLLPRRSVVWTCLHDELHAYLAPTRDLLSRVAGLVLNCEAEQHFIEQQLRIKHPATAVVGMGFDSIAGDAAAARRGFPQLPPRFVVYAGRLEPGKNVDVLIQYYRRYHSRRGNDLGLVLLGDGPLGRQDHAGLYALGFVDESSKRNLLAASTFLCQPSLTESFSIVLMESWLQARPVLVHEQCAVTLSHARAAAGGLYFADYADFEGAADYFLAHPAEADQMGRNGRNYVERYYSHAVVMDRMETALQRWADPRPTGD